MRLVLLLVRKDFLRRARAPLGLLLVLAFPIIFSLMLAVTFGTGDSEVPKVHLLIEDRDGGTLSGLLVSAFASEEMKKYYDAETVGEEGIARMERGEASALLRIPEGFGDAFVRGTPTTLRLVRNPAQGILPEIAEESSRVLVEVLSAGSRVLRGPLEMIAPYLDSDDEAPSDTSVADVAVAVNRLITRARGLVFPPAIALTTVSLGKPGDEESGSGMASIFLFILPGISVFTLFMVGEIGMRDLLTEGTLGTLRRQLSGPLGAGTLVAGKALFTAALALASLAILTAVGWAAARRGVDPAGFATLSLGLVLAVTGASALIFGLARNERQGATIASAIFLTMAFTGGSMVPLNSMPAAARGLAPYTLFYWGTSGYAALLRDGGGLADILPNAGVLAGVGALTLFLGARFLERRVRRGGAG